MEKYKATIKQAWPYQQDIMSLPVNDLDAALPFYEKMLGFHLVSRTDQPYKSAIVARDKIQVGLVENGGDPTQDGCVFEVDDVAVALAELKANGLTEELSNLSTQKHITADWKVFFVATPDGLCYCYGEQQSL